MEKELKCGQMGLNTSETTKTVKSTAKGFLFSKTNQNMKVISVTILYKGMEYTGGQMEEYTKESGI